MTLKITNLTSRAITKAGRERMGEAGRRNLADWHARVRTESAEADQRVIGFRDAILGELGPNPSASRLALAEAAVMTYSAMLLIQKELMHCRKKERPTWIERASWLTGNLTRLLKMLNLDAKARPRTLSDVLGSKVAPTTPESKGIEA